MAQEMIHSAGLVQDYSVIDHYMFQGLIICSKWTNLCERKKHCKGRPVKHSTEA